MLNKVLQLLENNRNIFITGPAGVGKTFLTESIIKHFKQKNEKILVCAPTGIAALNIKGITISSAFIIGFHSDPDYIHTLKDDANWKKYIKVLLKFKTIVIDEISMVSAELLDLVDLILQYVHKNTNPFGGVKLIAIGDFLQLKPVENDDANIRYIGRLYAFDSYVWPLANFEIMSLNEVYRQTDIDFINALHAIRYGDTKNKFVLRLINKIDYSNRPNEINKDFTFFVPTNAEADEINNAKFDLINEQPISFKATLKGENQQHIDKLRKRCIAKENLELKISEKVICIANDPGHQYVNGNIGTIIQMNDRIVTVRLLNNKIIYIRPFKWSHVDIRNNELATFEQIPLLPAYAITIHKSQGMTLDGAIIKPNNIFGEGMAYVALSRVKDSNNLFTTSRLPLTKINANKTALDFVKKFIK